ncbi:hypothetical protein Agub_g13412 [Astrephomene gubernaculifera]|uniref:Uncharacterized protein n=1 Tax=Astrephomene gubernaculifera TaxID=47775 RepID=A0AAD3DZS6_9CHLO|nr:hypothetical protein Agub_g13412 [Astrephomene gubernaculifera]
MRGPAWRTTTRPSIAPPSALARPARTGAWRLELRDHRLLPCLPPWLPRLPRLRHPDLSGCNELEGGGPEGVGGGLEDLAVGTGLRVLVLQRLSLDRMLPTPDEISYAAHMGRQPARRCLPDLTLGPSLRLLSLAANCFSQLPGWLGALSSLEHMDVPREQHGRSTVYRLEDGAGGGREERCCYDSNELHIRSPLTSLAALPHLRLRVHVARRASRLLVRGQMHHHAAPHPPGSGAEAETPPAAATAVGRVAGRGLACGAG